jgi:hypothetical protein
MTVRIDRLEDLIRANEAVKDEEFDMGVLAMKIGCDTVACLIGNYCLAYPRRGIRLTESFGFSGDEDVYDHFGIEVGDYSKLFAAWLPGTRRQCIARVKKFVAAKKREAKKGKAKS